MLGVLALLWRSVDAASPVGSSWRHSAWCPSTAIVSSLVVVVTSLHNVKRSSSKKMSRNGIRDATLSDVSSSVKTPPLKRKTPTQERCL